MNSMTGFGRAARSVRKLDLEVEVRSVNHRFLSLKIGLPAEMTRFEGDVDKLVRGALSRGSVTVTLTVKRAAAAGSNGFDEERLKKAWRRLDGVRRSLGLKEPLPLSAVLAVPQAWESGGADLDPETVWEGARPLVRRALEDLLKARAREGKRIGEDVEARLAAIEGAIARIRGRAPQVFEGYQRKLQERIDALRTAKGLELAQADLLKEIAVYADKCDISEELQRLATHVEAARRMLREGGLLGRRLDFLTQEMVRETNTLASKAGDSEISGAAVEVKAELEKIKEQAENLE